MSRGGKEIDFRSVAPASGRKRAVASTPQPLDGDRAHSFTISTSEADSRNGVTRGESAALANNIGDAHAKFEHASLLFEKPLIDRRRPLSVASIPATPAGDNRQVVKTAGRDRHLISRKLISEASRVLDEDELGELESFLDRIASEALFPEPASKDEVELVRLFPSGEIAR